MVLFEKAWLTAAKSGPGPLGSDCAHATAQASQVCPSSVSCPEGHASRGGAVGPSGTCRELMQQSKKRARSIAEEAFGSSSAKRLGMLGSEIG